MRLNGDLVQHYPLALGLTVLLLPYLYQLLLSPFTLVHYLRRNPAAGKEVVKTSSSLSFTQPSSSTTATSSAVVTSTAGGFNFWKGVRQIVGPKWEVPPDKTSKSTRSVKTSAKSKSKSKSTSTSTSSSKSTKGRVTTVKDVKTVTKSVTETLQITLEKPIEVVKTEGSVIIEEINIMGWHQVPSSRD